MHTGATEEDTPRVTAAHLRRADSLCALRLAKEHANKRGQRGPGVGFAVSNRIVDDARQAHSEMRVATTADFPVPTDLEMEQQRVYSAAAAWYVDLFGASPALAADIDDWATEDAEHGVLLSGQVGIAVDDAAGRPELRRLSVDRYPTTLDRVGHAFALLRVASWVGDRTLTIVSADLVGGRTASATVDPREDLPAARSLLLERLTVIRARTANPRPEPGQDCASCRFIAECGAHK